jgi:hypothetical protein
MVAATRAEQILSQGEGATARSVDGQHAKEPAREGLVITLLGGIRAVSFRFWGADFNWRANYSDNQALICSFSIARGAHSPSAVRAETR